MYHLYATLLMSTALVSLATAGRSQPRIWSEWQTQHLGDAAPAPSEGVLVYFHASATAPDTPIAMPVLEISRVARWPVLRINRREENEPGAKDADILQFALNEISRLRREGYTTLVVAGVGRGGELAISVAGSGAVEALLALAPGELRRADWDLLERQPDAALEILQRGRDDIARSLEKSKARRNAVVLFGDWFDKVPEGRAPAFRYALWQAGEAFLLVDRPAGLPPDPYDGIGRFVRRYRDCLVNFLSASRTPRREESCDLSRGFAVGSDIGFTSGRRRLQLPAFSHRSLAPFLGRWQGDNVEGEYMIMESVEAGASSITFRTGYSSGPWLPFEPPSQQEERFFLTDDGSGLYRNFGTGTVSLKLVDTGELERVVSSPKQGQEAKMRLQRQRDFDTRN